jgi:hypothetical protein
MGRVPSSVDISMIESFWSTLQRELLDTRTWQTPDRLGSAILEWSEAWYNPRRRHTALGMLAPAEYQRQHPTGPAPFPLSPKERHDHHTTRVRRTGAGSPIPTPCFTPRTPGDETWPVHDDTI